MKKLVKMPYKKSGIILFFLFYLIFLQSTEANILEEFQKVEKMALVPPVESVPPVEKCNVDLGNILFFVKTRKYKYEKFQTEKNLKTNTKLFEKGKPLNIIIHGFQSNSDQLWVRKMTEAFLKNKILNIVLIDWSKISNCSTPEYAQVVSFMVNASKYISLKMQEFEMLCDIPAYKIHILGHSLGAHIAGMIGLEFKYIYGKEIGRITGLDPALPLFGKAPDKFRLDASDAAFVDIIHTDAGKFGIDEPAGSVDFYPQGGVSPQPACDYNNQEIFIGCSHSLSHDYYMESINSRKFKAKKCFSYEKYLKNQCDDLDTVMGEHVNTNARGKYYLSVNAFVPYAKDGKV